MKSLKHFRPFVAGTINERNSLEQYYIYVIFVNIFVKEKASAAKAAAAYTARFSALALSGKERPMASRILAC
jgi:hypothetical protein